MDNDLISVFTASADVWHGGDYELAIELGPRDDARLDAAIRAIWNRAELDGCFARGDVEPADQSRIVPSLKAAKKYGFLRGTAALPNAKAVSACGTFVVREEDTRIDWLGLSLPMGSLHTAYNVGGYPIEDGNPSRPWREPTDEWLVQVARDVFAVTPYPLALIGHLVSGMASADEVAAQGIPAKRWDSYLWREQGELRWYPPTTYDAPVILNGGGT